MYVTEITGLLLDLVGENCKRCENHLPGLSQRTICCFNFERHFFKGVSMVMNIDVIHTWGDKDQTPNGPINEE